MSSRSTDFRWSPVAYSASPRGNDQTGRWRGERDSATLSSMSAPLSGEELDAFLDRVEAAADTYVRGDMTTYVELVHHADPLVETMSLDDLAALMSR